MSDRPDNLAIKSQVQRILGSQWFDQADRHSRFLQFIVDEALAGRGNSLKGKKIGVMVFDRPEDFDAQTDPIVRVEAGRLRSRLASYYAAEGKADPIRIDIPKGSYVPEFELVATPEAEARPPQGGRQRTGLWHGAAIGAGVVLVLLLLSQLFQSDSTSNGLPLASALAYDPLPDWPTVSVAPLSNLSPESDLDYFADGMREEIMLHLREYELLVIAGDTEFSDQPGITGADYQLTGSIRTDGSRIRLLPRLVSTDTGQVLWLNDYDIEAGARSLIETQQEVAREVAAAIALPYGPIFEREYARLIRYQPQSMETYSCMLRYFAYRRRVDMDLLDETRACFEQAVEREPGYADAWAGLALILQDSQLYGAGNNSTPVALETVREAADTAIELDPDAFLGWLAKVRYLFLTGDLDQYFDAANQLLELAPTEPLVLGREAQHMVMLGYLDAAVELAERAKRLDPNPNLNYQITDTLIHLTRGEYDLALEAAQRINAPNWYPNYVFVAVAAGNAGETDTARYAAESLLELRPDFESSARSIFATFNINEDMLPVFLNGLRSAGLEID